MIWSTMYLCAATNLAVSSHYMCGALRRCYVDIAAVSDVDHDAAGHGVDGVKQQRVSP